MGRKNKRDEASTKVAADASKALTNLVREQGVAAGLSALVGAMGTTFITIELCCGIPAKRSLQKVVELVEKDYERVRAIVEAGIVEAGMNEPQRGME